LLATLVIVAVGCDEDKVAAPEQPAPKPPSRVEIVPAPAGGEEATSVIQRESARAEKDGRTLLVYVGAPWCEPCRRFHEAAARGDLDQAFPKLRLLEFDHDRDEARLERAACVSRLIPLFAKPDADGRCSGAQIEGSIKGPGAVAEITPRLSRLLSR
jgi:thiol-disulfide isomerase/thioredoxin